MAQLVEHILGKDEVPSSNLGSSSKKKSTAIAVLFFLERCLPRRASDVAFGNDVHCVSDISPYGEVGKHHITVRQHYITVRQHHITAAPAITSHKSRCFRCLCFRTVNPKRNDAFPVDTQSTPLASILTLPL